MLRTDVDNRECEPSKREERERANETDKRDNSESESKPNIQAAAVKKCDMMDMANITPLSSLEILTNNPTSYTKNVGPAAAVEVEMTRHESADRFSRSRSCSRSPASACASSDSSCSPQFSPIPIDASAGNRDRDQSACAREPSSPSPVQAHMPYLYDNCDYKFLMHQRPRSTELLHYPVPTLETFSMPGSNGSRYLIAAPIPRKVPCVILPPSTSTGDFNNNGHPDKNISTRVCGSRSPDKSTMPLNYSTSRHGDGETSIRRTRKGISPHSSPIRNPRSPSSASRDENSNSIDEVQMMDVSTSTENANAKPRINTKSSKLTFGMDRILSNDGNNDSVNRSSPKITKDNISIGEFQDGQGIYSAHDLMQRSAAYTSNQFMRSLSSHQHQHALTAGGGASACSPIPRNCPECVLLAKFGYKLQFSDGRPMPVPTSTLPTSSYAAGGYGPIFTGSGLTSPWLQHHKSHPSSSLYDGPTLIPSNGFGHSNLPTSYGLGASNYASMSSMVSCNTNGGGRRKRSWSRAVFSNLQRKGLEKRFQMQKYITKPDRRQLAAMLGLTDAQVKVWFQNRRMKWRHTKEGKSGSAAIDHSSLMHTPVANASATVTAGIIPGKEKSSRNSSLPGHHASMTLSSGKK